MVRTEAPSLRDCVANAACVQTQKEPGIVIALALALLGWGGYVASQSPLDVFPEFVAPQVTIQAEAPGLTTTSRRKVPARYRKIHHYLQVGMLRNRSCVDKHTRSGG